MLENVKLLLGITDTTKDSLISLLITLATDYAVTFCNLSEYNTALDTVVIKMVVENYNKLGNESISSVSYGGVSESYVANYSDETIALLKKFRKIVCL